jgi:phage terminase small subunit
LQDKIFYGLEITAEGTLRETARVAHSDLRKLYDENGNLIPIQLLDDATAACVAGIEIVRVQKINKDTGEITTEQVKRYKLWDKNSALDRLHKHFRLSPDAKEITGANGQALFPNAASGDDRAKRVLEIMLDDLGEL